MPQPSRSTSIPDDSWEHRELYDGVVRALYAVPAYFASSTVIEGLVATDLQTLNQVLGATIESQVVATLNSMRRVWDPADRYGQYAFVRQAQVFPDVLLKADQNGEEILLGIELKGWYLLAKERMPNFRFQVTSSACAKADLIVVVPWALEHVLSGGPVAYKPYVESARYAAEFRNHWWSEIRESDDDRDIVLPDEVGPYPSKGDRIADKPAVDRGGNFGRLARTGLMDEYIAEMLKIGLSGIPVDDWIQFFRRFRQ